MKYCPNPSCPTLLELGIVAEYEKQVTHCVDCDTKLISADAPPQITPQPVPTTDQTPQHEQEHQETSVIRVCPNRDCPALAQLGRAAEYEEHVVYCVDCGTPLVSTDGPLQFAPREYPTTFEQQATPAVKVCPNPKCPTLVELGFVAEYEGDIDYCEDCGTELVPADSPPESQMASAQPTPRAGGSREETALLGSFAAQEDIELVLQECKRQDIPVIVKRSTETQEVVEEVSQETEVVSLYDLIVRQEDLFRAMNVLVELFREDADGDHEEESDVGKEA